MNKLLNELINTLATGTAVHSAPDGNYTGLGVRFTADTIQEALDAGLVYVSARTTDVKWLGLTNAGREAAKGE